MRVRGRKRGRPLNGSTDKRSVSLESALSQASSSSSSPSKSPRKRANKPAAVAVTMKQRTPISKSFIEYQQVNDMSLTTADAHLICSDGFFPVHTVVLQSVSPFFKKMFTAQGDYYFGTRPVILPDWSVTEIGPMVQFIYTGLANVSESQVESLKELLEYFKVSVLAEDLLTERKSSALAVQQQILHFKGKEAEDAQLSCSVLPPTGVKRKAEDVGDTPATPKRITVSKKGEGTLDKDVIVVIPRNNDISCKLREKEVAPPKAIDPPEQGSSTDTSDGEINIVDSKPSDWFVRESRRCQKCDKIYNNPADASSCLTNNHSRLRCYLCFKIVRDTSKLFVHFAKKHKKGAREQSLLCNWCDQTVAYRSVSCHVISLHLTTMMSVPENPGKTNRFQGRRGPQLFRRPGPPLSGLNSSKGITNPGENNGNENDTEDGEKDKEFMITNKDDDESIEAETMGGLSTQKQTIRIRSICGKTRVFIVNLEKKG